MCVFTGTCCSFVPQLNGMKQDIYLYKMPALETNHISSLTQRRPEPAVCQVSQGPQPTWAALQAEYELSWSHLNGLWIAYLPMKMGFSSPYFSPRGMYCWLAYLGVPRLWGNLVMVSGETTGFGSSLFPLRIRCIKKIQSCTKAVGEQNEKVGKLSSEL